MKIKRSILSQVKEDLKNFPIVALLGPRQSGKTTLAKDILSKEAIYLDLERPSDRNKLTDAEAFLSLHKKKLICLDEIQLQENLFPLLRSLVDDQRKKNGQFLILGSSSPELLRQSSETLAGRISYNYVTPLSYTELIQNEKKASLTTRLWRGGYPDSYLANKDKTSIRWRENYITTFLERDLRNFGIETDPQQIRRLWQMCSHVNGQIINLSKLANSLDKTHPTVKSYFDILESTFMLRRLPIFSINTKKRLVKSPKLYFRDSGILCSLLNIASFEELISHPAYGSCWEGFCIENILLSNRYKQAVSGFFRTHTGQELDLVIQDKNKMIGFEFKASNSPKLSKENYQAAEITKVDKIWVITPNSDRYPIDGDQIEVISLKDYLIEINK